MIPRMTRMPNSSKVVLVADQRVEAGPGRDTPIRRYRLARVQFSGEPLRGFLGSFADARLPPGSR